MDDEGNIYGRGAQDMKCVGMQYLGALRYFMQNNISFKRTIHVLFVAEEELAGADGMKAFIETDAFRALDIAFALDEGIASENDVFNIFYAERLVWRKFHSITVYSAPNTSF